MRRCLIFCGILTLLFAWGPGAGVGLAVRAAERYFGAERLGRLPVADATGITYYVDGFRGNDAWDGRAASYHGGRSGPFRTIGHALDRYSGRVKGGNTVKIRAGTYHTRINLGNLTGAVSEATRFTIGSYGDGEVVIDASDSHLVSWQPVAGQKGLYQADWNLKLGGQPVPPAAVILDDNFKLCRPVYRYQDLSADGRWFWDAGARRLFVQSHAPPAARQVTVVKYDRDNVDYGIYLTGDYVTVFGLTVRGAGSYGIHGTGDRNRVEQCEVKYCGKAGIKMYGKSAELFRNHVAGNVMLNWPRGNTWDSSGGWPNGMTGSSFAHIAGNLVHDNGGEGIGSMAGEGGLIVEDNQCWDNWSVNIYLDSQANDLVRRNLVYCTGVRPAEAIEAGRVPRWSSMAKLLKRMRPEGIMTGDEKATSRTARSANHRIYSNIIVNCAKGYSHYGQAAGAGIKGLVLAYNTIVLPEDPGGGETWVGIDLPDHGGRNAGSVVSSNVVVGFRRDTPLVRLGEVGGIRLDHNLYFNQATRRCFQSGRLLQRSFDLAEWRAALAMEAGSRFADPGFRRSATALGWDLRPRAEGGALGLGDPGLTREITQDFQGKARHPARPAAGALEGGP